MKRFIGVDFDFGALKNASTRYWLWVGVLGVFLTMGVIAWSQLITHGGAVLGMRDDYPWGLWFVDYMYYIGLAAGGLVVYASVHLFGAKQFTALSRIAVLQAGVLTMMALMGILTDMERPARMIWFMLTPNPTSPFLYTGSAAGGYMALCFVDLWVLITGKGGHKLAMTMTLIALPFAIYMHTTTAFVLSMNKSQRALALGGDGADLPDLGDRLGNLAAAHLRLHRAVDHPDQVQTEHVPQPGDAARHGHDHRPVPARGRDSRASSGRRRRCPDTRSGCRSSSPATTRGRSCRCSSSGSRRSSCSRGVPLGTSPAVQITAAAMYLVAVLLKRYSLMAMGFARNTLGQLTRHLRAEPGRGVPRARHPRRSGCCSSRSR